MAHRRGSERAGHALEMDRFRARPFVDSHLRDALAQRLHVVEMPEGQSQDARVPAHPGTHEASDRRYLNCRPIPELIPFGSAMNRRFKGGHPLKRFDAGGDPDGCSEGGVGIHNGILSSPAATIRASPQQRLASGDGLTPREGRNEPGPEGEPAILYPPGCTIQSRRADGAPLQNWT